VSRRGVFSFATDTTIQCVSIMITNDNISENNWECFTVSLSGASEYIAYPTVATVCIIDDDGQWLAYWQSGKNDMNYVSCNFSMQHIQ